MKTPLTTTLAALAFCILAGCAKSTDEPISPELPVQQGLNGYVVYFNNDRNATYSHLTTLKFDGTGDNIILKDTLTEGHMPYNTMTKWSFDRSRIIFVSDRVSGTIFSDLFVINNDGTGLKQITNTPGIRDYLDWK